MKQLEITERTLRGQPKAPRLRRPKVEAEEAPGAVGESECENQELIAVWGVFPCLIASNFDLE